MTYQPGDNSGRIITVISRKRTPKLYTRLCNALEDYHRLELTQQELREEITMHRRIAYELAKMLDCNKVDGDALIKALTDGDEDGQICGRVSQKGAAGE
jgi:hypothetical protein